MKPEAKPEVPEVYPDTPAWTMFFDGPLYQKYSEFMKEKDFSKILLTSKLKLANLQGGDAKPEGGDSRHEEWWDTEIDLDQEKAANPNIYTSVSEEYYRDVEDEKRRIKRRTRAYIVLGLVILAALAFGTALVIHYFFVPPDEDPSLNVNISLSENIAANTSGISGASTVLPTGLKPDLDLTNDLTDLLNEFLPKDKGRGKKKNKTEGKHELETTTLPKQTTTSTSTAKSTTTTESSFVDLYDFFGVDDTWMSNTSTPLSRGSSTTSSTEQTTTPSQESSTNTEPTTTVEDITTTTTGRTSTQQTSQGDVTITTTDKPSTTTIAASTEPEATTEDYYDYYDSYTTTTHDWSTTEGEKTTRHNVTTEQTETTHLTNDTTEQNHQTTPIPQTTIRSSDTSTKPPTTSQVEQSTTIGFVPTTSERSNSTDHDKLSSSTSSEVTKSKIGQQTTIVLYSTSTPLVSEASTITIGVETETPQLSTPSAPLSPTESLTSSSSITSETTTNTSTMAFAQSTTTTTEKQSITTTVDVTATSTGQLTTTVAVPTTSAESHASTTEIPTTASELPTTTSEIPIKFSELPTTSEIPATSSELPTTTSKIPTTTAELPKTTSEMPTTSSVLPTTTSEIPSTSGTMPTIPSELPTTTSGVPTTTSKLPKTTEIPTKTHTELPTTTPIVQTTLPENYNMLKMFPITAYTGESTKINCNVKYAVHWKYISIRTKSNWNRLEVRLYNDGRVTWSRGREDRHDVTYDVKPEDGSGMDINMDLIINKVECGDSQIFLCILESKVSRNVESSKLAVFGKPDTEVRLKLGPSIIEGKALRLTATWSAGYPKAWTNISWMAIDTHNKTYNLAEFGKYREYDLLVDDARCETLLTQSFVIFPNLELNATAVTVAPDLAQVRYFVTDDMKGILRRVKPGQEEILVIPRNYCPKGDTETFIPHPYTKCNKYIRCLPDDLVIMQCAGGTCFYEGLKECV